MPWTPKEEFRFNVKERLGRGSLAVVFRAVDVQSGREVALKVAAGDSAKHFQRIRSEAEILAALHHPSIIRFLAEGIMPAGSALHGHPFLVEELALGPTLKDVAARGSSHPAVVAAWARSLFEALRHIHGRGLVHRDIKPANLMLSGLRRSPVRLVDFGIAVAAGSAPEPGISSGTVHYMSPEQACGEAAQPAWDVYALGLVLLELLTGTKAYPGTTVESLVARTLRSPAIPASLGSGWCGLLQALTAMESAERPTAAQAAEMAGQLMP